MTPKSDRRPVRRLTDEEEAQVQAQIASDPDNPEITDEQIAASGPASKVLPPELFAALKRRGRPKSADKRVQLTLRVRPHVVEAFKSTGPGWQTRMNEVLAAAAADMRKSA